MADMGDMEGGQVVIGTRGALMNMTWYLMALLSPCTPLKSNMVSTMWTLFLPPTSITPMKLLLTMLQLCTILLLTMLLLDLPLLSFPMAMPCTRLKSSMMSTLLTFSPLLMCIIPITPMKLPTMLQLSTILLLTLLWLDLPLLSFPMAMPCIRLKSSMMSTLLTFSLPLMCMASIMLRQQLSRMMLYPITMPLPTALQCTLMAMP